MRWLPNYGLNVAQDVSARDHAMKKPSEDPVAAAILTALLGNPVFEAAHTASEAMDKDERMGPRRGNYDIDMPQLDPARALDPALSFRPN
jgi:hypothetical protein